MEETNNMSSVTVSGDGAAAAVPEKTPMPGGKKAALIIGIVLGGGAYLAGEGLLHFYSTDETVVAAGLARMKVICTSYFLCGIMDTLASCLRGRGYSVIPMIVSLVGSCLLRLVWIATIFRMFRSTGTLYISYPLSWALTAGVHLICLLVVRKKMNDQLKEESRLAV